MTRLTQKFVFFVALISFANIVSAHNWPVFSTQNINQEHILLDVAFGEEAGYTDENYGYDLDATAPLFPLINQTINNKAILLLTPTIEESEANEMFYNIIFNDINLGQINMTRTILNDEELEKRQTKHERFRDAKHQIVDGNVGEGVSNLIHVVEDVIVQTVKKESKSLERRGKHWRKKYKF